MGCQSSGSTEVISSNVEGLITKYYYDGNELIFEKSGAAVLYYIHGPRIDEIISDSRGYCYHSDGLGSIVNLTDSTGSKANSYTYTAFGNIRNQSGTVSNPWLYTGRQYDSESGLYYYRNRYYDAKVGRFITRDPIGIAGGINLYNYCYNSPINWVDPKGLATGDPYPSQDVAGKAAVNDINPTSISQGREYGGYVYKNSDGTSSYTPPVPGTKDSVNLGPKPSNANITVTGDYHTHGANDIGYKNEDFSDTDKTGYTGDYSTGYLGTPSGAVKKYNSKTGKITDITGENGGKQKCN